MVKMHFVDSLL